MNSHAPSVRALVQRVLDAQRGGRRRLVALAGPPASGKSTMAQHLAAALCDAGCDAQVVPMDGFHLHNPILVKRGLLRRKGAPETFDVSGFVALVQRLHDEPEVFYPIFDRDRDIAIAGAGTVGASCDTVIVEGNYLLYDAPLWRDLRAHWDYAVRLDVPQDILRERLVARWLSHGMSPEQAEARAAENDLPNARLVTEAALQADITV